MRILAVRGSNLASLANFAVDFESEPLAGTGLFAITGPTGAGKSTLLDALCLALYDRTPRLSSPRRGALVGHAAQEEGDRIRSSDPRLVLRHGTASGFAEVDFRGRDGGRYRARWEVRRARRRISGRLQDQKVTLTSLDSGRGIGGTKTETLKEIEARLGLSFEQFRRSVLLAQGDFAAFLRADKNERADLLERMTGTEIYGRISEVAYRRAGEELAALESLKGVAGALPILEPEALQALQNQRAEAASAVAGLAKEHARIEQTRRFYARARELGEALRAARGEATGAPSMREQAALIDKDVELVRKAMPLKERAQRLRTLDKDLEETKSTQERGDAELERAVQALAAATTGERTAARASEELRRRAKTLRPEIELAREIEADLRVACGRREELDAALEKARQEIAAAWAAREAGDKALTAVESEARSVTDWLDDKEALAVLFREWSRWDAELGRAQDAFEELSKARAAEEQIRERGRALQGRVDGARTAVEEANTALQGARAVADAARERAAAVPLQDVRRRLDGQRDELERIIRGLGIARTACAAAGSIRDASKEASESKLEIARLEAVQVERREQRSLLEARLEEADTAFQRLQLALSEDVRGLRGQLEEALPCSVCGSTEHPYRADGGPGRAILDEQRKRAVSLRDQQRAMEGELGADRERLRSLQAAAQRADATQREAQEQLASAREEWTAYLRERSELDGLEDATSERTTQWLEARAAALRESIEVSRAQELDAALLAKELSEAEDVAKARQSDLEQVRRRHAELIASSEQIALERAELKAVLEAASRSEKTAEQTLLPVFESLEQSRECSQLARGEVRKIRERLAGLAVEWRQREERLGLLNRDIARARATAEAAKSEWDRCNRARGELEAQHGAARAAERELRNARLEVLEGRTVAEVSEELERGLEASTAKREASASHRSDCEKTLASAQERARALAKEQRGLLAEADELRAKLSAGADELGLGLEEALALVTRDESALAKLSREASRLRTAAARFETVVVERQRALQEHFESEQTLDKEEPPSLEVELHRISEHLEEARRVELEHAARLKEDARAREARGRVEGRIAEAAERARIYGSLKELIGSADGRRFRVFAQSLTLDALIEQANVHLRELIGRYRLQRIPGQDLEIQVIDRDMGDEIRSVQSLSGGESFLVSLALALGLSSLSARDTKIESLLIDEGFGTLDPDTLDVALSVLDALQASGRKVGLISHVPGMAERVGVRIDVQPRGGGKSDVRVVA